VIFVLQAGNVWPIVFYDVMAPEKDRKEQKEPSLKSLVDEAKATEREFGSWYASHEPAGSGTRDTTHRDTASVNDIKVSRFSSAQTRAGES
jgi:hypothetical protein